jgi:Domain of unknown function (DUF5680)
MHDHLRSFLRTAKRATYAAQGDEATVVALLGDSKQLEFREGAYLYRDIYVGMFRFVGQEIVYESSKAVWSMSYAGGLVSSASAETAKSVYAVLRAALLKCPDDLPLRGPTVLDQGGLSYLCEVNGSLEQFHGVETIRQGDEAWYALRFSGGVVR